MSYFKKQFNSKNFPNANLVKDQILCLPIYPTMTDKEINFVVKTLDR